MCAKNVMQTKYGTHSEKLSRSNDQSAIRIDGMMKQMPLITVEQKQDEKKNM